MKKSRGISLCAMLAVATMMAAPAFADRGGRGDWGNRGDRGGFEQRFGRVDPAERREIMRDMRREDGWRERYREGSPGFGHMSPEERRQLRHDIRSARDGIYRRPPPPPPGQFPGYGTP